MYNKYYSPFFNFWLMKSEDISSSQKPPSGMLTGLTERSWAPAEDK